MDFTRRIELDTTYDDAIARVTAALEEQGFGILTEIDVRQTLKDKLDIDVDAQIILGACNPELAHRALRDRPPRRHVAAVQRRGPHRERPHRRRSPRPQDHRRGTRQPRTRPHRRGSRPAHPGRPRRPRERVKTDISAGELHPSTSMTQAHSKAG